MDKAQRDRLFRLFDLHKQASTEQEKAEVEGVIREIIFAKQSDYEASSLEGEEKCLKE